MVGLQTVPCHIASMRWGIVSLEENFFFPTIRDWQDMQGKDFHPYYSTGL